MTSATRAQALRYALVVVGLIAIFGLFPLTRLWPSGWRWGTEGELYLQMIVGIYATLGVFLIIAARDPGRHLSLIWFTVWSSIVHGGIMAAQSIVYPMHRGHLVGDVPALFVIAAVLAYLTPRREAGTALAK
jgi:hypothetical protein